MGIRSTEDKTALNAKVENAQNVPVLQEKHRLALERLHTEMTEAHLWEALICFEGYPFQTFKQLQFTYTIKGNEMFVDRKDKSITRATVELAFQKAIKLGSEVTGPKKLGCFGASYLYPVFVAFGVIGN